MFLDGTSSKDPDDQNATVWDAVQWSCEDITDASAACGWQLPTAGVVWNLTSLISNSRPRVIKVSMRVQKAGRADTANVTIVIVDMPVPEASVLNIKPKYSPDLKIVLEGRGVAVSNEFSDLSYLWSAVALGSGGQEGAPLQLNSIASTPLSNKVLVLRPQSLVGGLAYRFQLAVFDGRATAVCKADVVMNVAPHGGAVTVEPSDGYAISTTFTIASSSASSWQDEDIPLTFAFSYSATNRTDAPHRSLTTSSLSISTSAVLPAGHPDNNYMCQLHVTVTDAYGAKGSSSVPVRVAPYAVPAGSTMANAAAALLEGSGSSASSQLVSAFASSLNGASSGQSVEAAAATREILSKSLLGSVTALTTGGGAAAISPEVVLMVGQGLTAVTAKPGEITAAAMDSALDAVEMLTVSTSGPSKVISSAVVSSLASAMSNLLAAMNTAPPPPPPPGTPPPPPKPPLPPSVMKANARRTVSVVAMLSQSLLGGSTVGEQAVSVSTGSFNITVSEQAFPLPADRVHVS